MALELVKIERETDAVGGTETLRVSDDTIVQRRVRTVTGTEIFEEPGSGDVPAHASSHGAAGSDPVQLAESQVTNLEADLAALAGDLANEEADRLAADDVLQSSIAGKVPATRQVIAGSGLSGGGDLSDDRTFDVVNLTNSHIANAAAIDWSKISKSGSSLADLDTRSAADLATGTLADARLSSNVPLKDAENVFTANQRISKTRGDLTLLHSGSAPARLAVALPESSYFAHNLYWDGSTWNLDDTAKDGWMLFITVGSGANGSITIYKASAGSNPRTLTSVAQFGESVIDALIGGIRFPASQVASSNANTLDDYEEGTFTPVITGTGGGTGSYNLQFGRYVKIGQMVHIQLWVGLTSLGSISGFIDVSGLPFTAHSDANTYCGMTVPYWANTNTAFTWMGGYVRPNTTGIGITGASGAQTSVTNGVQHTDLTNDFQIMFGGTYRAAA